MTKASQKITETMIVFIKLKNKQNQIFRDASETQENNGDEDHDRDEESFGMELKEKSGRNASFL